MRTCILLTLFLGCPSCVRPSFNMLVSCNRMALLQGPGEARRQDAAQQPCAACVLRWYIVFWCVSQSIYIVDQILGLAVAGAWRSEVAGFSTVMRSMCVLVPSGSGVSRKPRTQCTELELKTCSCRGLEKRGGRLLLNSHGQHVCHDTKWFWCVPQAIYIVACMYHNPFPCLFGVLLQGPGETRRQAAAQ
jgi:hypothetical protein